MAAVMTAGAVLSECGRYRYALTREWLTGAGTCLFVMLNPSTADAEQDDPTIRRCVDFAQRWGYQRLAVANLCAFRATNPDLLPAGDEAVGPDANYWIVGLAHEADLVVAAWGERARPGRAAEVLGLLAPICPVYALKVTRSPRTQPRHPLYLKGSLTPFVYRRQTPLELP